MIEVYFIADFESILKPKEEINESECESTSDSDSEVENDFIFNIEKDDSSDDESECKINKHKTSTPPKNITDIHKISAFRCLIN